MRSSLLIVLAGLLTACATPPDPMLDNLEAVTPTTVPAGRASLPGEARDTEPAARGKYLVELLGCGACHTDGALIGEPNRDRHLAGSRVGIAVSNPIDNQDPAIVFPPNLTPDPTTGIGGHSDDDIKAAIRAGIGQHGIRMHPVMPFPAYAAISDPDINAIVAYLRNVPPVVHRVPDNVSTGHKTRKLYVHFGVYRSKR